MTGNDQDWLVFRHSPTFPPEFWNGSLEGRWLDMRMHANGATMIGFWIGQRLVAVAEPSNRFESNDAGMVAEIWEVRAGTPADVAHLDGPAS